MTRTKPVQVTAERKWGAASNRNAGDEFGSTSGEPCEVDLLAPGTLHRTGRSACTRTSGRAVLIVASPAAVMRVPAT